MAGSQRKVGRPDIPFNRVEIGMADAATDHLQECLAGAGLWDWELCPEKRLLFNRKLL